MKVRSIAANILLALLIVGFVSPIYWMFITSFKLNRDIFSLNPLFEPTLNNYLVFFGLAQLGLEAGEYMSFTHTYSFTPFLANSVIASCISTFIAVSLGAMAGYAFARYKSKRSDDLAFFILSLRMAPPILASIPLFIMFRALNLFDSIPTLVIAYTTFSLPFAIWMMKGVFEELPVDMEESALVDGCSWWEAFLRVALPLSKTGLAAVAILCFIFSWNEFLLSWILTTRKAVTVTVAFSYLITEQQMEWGPLMAGGVIASVPILMLSLFIQKYIVRGLTFGAIKG